ncbi:MAG: hypothetical protein V1766_02540 [Pseudomonadota bacterium]
MSARGAYPVVMERLRFAGTFRPLRAAASVMSYERHCRERPPSCGFEQVNNT